MTDDDYDDDDDDECLKSLQHFINVHLNIKNALLRCCSGILTTSCNCKCVASPRIYNLAVTEAFTFTSCYMNKQFIICIFSFILRLSVIAKIS